VVSGWSFGFTRITKIFVACVRLRFTPRCTRDHEGGG